MFQLFLNVFSITVQKLVVPFNNHAKKLFSREPQGYTNEFSNSIMIFIRLLVYSILVGRPMPSALLATLNSCFILQRCTESLYLS